LLDDVEHYQLLIQLVLDEDEFWRMLDDACLMMLA